MIQVYYMNSKDLRERGFTEPILFVKGEHSTAPAETGVYIIMLQDRETDYPMGKSDIVKIGKSEFKQGIRRRWYNYYNPGPTQHTNIRLKPKFEKQPHTIAWLLLPKGDAKRMEDRLLLEFKREHGQFPAYNLIKG